MDYKKELKDLDRELEIARSIYNRDEDTQEYIAFLITRRAEMLNEMREVSGRCMN